jgi:transposase
VLTIPPAVKLWYAPQPVDFRLGFDGLFALVQSRLAADPMSGHLFIFHNKSGDRVKVLYWGRHGLCLWAQRLEAGRYHFPLPADGAARLELTPAQFAMILDGIDLSHVRRFKRFTPAAPAPTPNPTEPVRT